MYNPETKSVYLSRNMRFDYRDLVTGHRAQEENDGTRAMSSFFTLLVTPAVTRYLIRSERDYRNSTEEPIPAAPKRTPPVLMQFKQTIPVPYYLAEHYNQALLPAPPASLTPADSESEEIILIQR